MCDRIGDREECGFSIGNSYIITGASLLSLGFNGKLLIGNLSLNLCLTVPSSKKLANSIHSNLKNVMTKKFNLKDRGIKPGLFYVLALSKRPGVLIEAGFMSNKKEIKKIK